MVKRLLKVLRNWGFLFENKKFLIGIVILCSVWIVSSIGQFMTSYLLNKRFALELPPSVEHPLGTDTLGKDILAQLFIGTNTTLRIMFIAGILGISIGMLVGFITGYYKRATSSVLMSITDIFLVVPSLPLLILISSYVKVMDELTIALFLSIFNWAWPARVIRAQVLSLKERSFVLISKLSGLNDIEIILREIAPNMLSFLGVNFMTATAGAALAEIGIELLGLGLRHTYTLGTILYWAMYSAAVVKGKWWWWCPPVLMLILIFTSLFLIHTGLDEISNPRLREKG